MDTPEPTWEQMKAAYLRDVRQALARTPARGSRDIIAEVKSHLEQRFAELLPEQHGPEVYAQIIEDMGPVDEYGEWLVPAQTVGIEARRRMWPVGLLVGAVILVGGGFLWWHTMPPPVAYIIRFAAAEDYPVETVRQLLKAFNDEVQFRVKTHHYRPQIVGGRVYGAIAVDSREERDLLKRIISDARSITWTDSQAVSQRQWGLHVVSTVPRPRVVVTHPSPLADNVSPALKTISVTFTEPMGRGYSWVQFDDDYPDVVGKPYFDTNESTCFLPCTLEPGQVYRVGINSDKFQHFQSRYGMAAKPFLLVFATQDRKGNATPIPEDWVKQAERVNAKHGGDLSKDVTLGDVSF